MRKIYFSLFALLMTGMSGAANANLFDEWSAMSSRGTVGNYFHLGTFYVSDKVALIIEDDTTGENATTTDNTSELLLNFSVGYEFKSGVTVGGKILSSSRNAGREAMSGGVSGGYFYGPWFMQFSYLFYAAQVDGDNEYLDGSGYAFDFSYMFEISDGFSFGPMFSYMTTRYDSFQVSGNTFDSFAGYEVTRKIPQFLVEFKL